MIETEIFFLMNLMFALRDTLKISSLNKTVNTTQVRMLPKVSSMFIFLLLTSDKTHNQNLIHLSPHFSKLSPSIFKSFVFYFCSQRHRRFIVFKDLLSPYRMTVDHQLPSV